MDAQDFRSLQEAYMEVVENQQLDELSDRTVSNALNARIAATGAASDRAYKHRNPEAMRAAETASGKEASMRSAAAKRRKRKLGEEMDIYDIILSHLLDEGYAETPEAAEAIMVNMSEEWRQSIVEVLDTPERANQYGKKVVKSMLGAAAKSVLTKDKGYLKTIDKRLKGAKMVKRKAEKKAAEES
jgi:hypothetical protein